MMEKKKQSLKHYRRHQKHQNENHHQQQQQSPIRMKCIVLGSAGAGKLFLGQFTFTEAVNIRSPTVSLHNANARYLLQLQNMY